MCNLPSLIDSAVYNLITVDVTEMTTAAKLWIGFGALTVLLVLTNAAILLRLKTIDGDIRAMADVARPRSAAAREIEINLLGFALAVRTLDQTRDPKFRELAEMEAASIEKHLAEYQHLAVTSRQSQMAEEFAVRWRVFREIGRGLMRDAPEHPSEDEWQPMAAYRMELEQFLDEEMQPDAVAAYDAQRQAAVGEVSAVERFVFILVILVGAIAIVTGTVVGRGVVTTERELQTAKDNLDVRVRERTAELVVSNAALAVSNKELEQFASVASHDLQEPLRKIQAFGDRLQTKYAEGLGEQGGAYVSKMLLSAARMRGLIDALLEFSRLTTKAHAFSLVDLTAAALDAVSDLEGRIHFTGGKVEIGVLPTIDADPIQMQQLFLNLIGNGLKFQKTDEPPIVNVEARIIEVGRDAAMCEISVRDNGIGFEEVYLDRIFDVFQRLHGRHEYEGTGMGLAICRKIVERHGGTITATGKPGTGSIFLVTLPVNQA